MSLCKILLGLLFGVLLIISSEQARTSGPYDVNVEQIFLCEDQGTNLGKFNIKMYLKRNANGEKVRVHKGGFYYPLSKDQEKDFEIHADFYQKKGNDYLFMYKYDGAFCDTLMKIAEPTYSSFRENMGLDPKNCDFEIGNYTFNDWDVPFALPMPMLEYGYYKVTFQLMYQKEVASCLHAIANVKEKEIY